MNKSKVIKHLSSVSALVGQMMSTLLSVIGLDGGDIKSGQGYLQGSSIKKNNSK
jgi:hypothetical protein